MRKVQRELWYVFIAYLAFLAILLLGGCTPSKQAEYVECLERNKAERYCQYKVYGRQVHRPIKHVTP